MGLIGQNISYSLSPVLHNRSAEELNIDISYLCMDLLPRQVAPFLEMAFHSGAVGFNVTKPHKKLVAELVESPLQSINTITRGEEGWEGYSTDIQGLIQAIRQMKVELKTFKKIVIMGGGGVCIALLEHIAKYFDEGPEVVVVRRSAHRDNELSSIVSDRFKLSFRNFVTDDVKDEIEGRAGETLWLQSTSAPLSGNDLEEFAPIIDAFDGVFVDMVYGTPSKIYHQAVKKGILCQDGLPMLIEQARASQDLWWGKSVSSEFLARQVHS